MQRLGQFSLVGGREHHHVGNRAQVAQVEHAVVRRTVLADESGTVEAEDHVQVLQRDVHDHLVVGTLHERRVDRDDRQKTADRQAGRHADGVLLGDTDVVEAVRIRLGEAIQARAGRHGRRDGDDALIPGSLRDERARERLGEADGAA